MAISDLEYQLQNGYIHNWLVAGPQAICVQDLHRFDGADFKLQIAHDYLEREVALPQAPVERDTFTAGGTDLTWRYIRCVDDHFVDLTAFYHTCHYLQARAYAQVVCPSTQTVNFILTTNGPADL